MQIRAMDAAACIGCGACVASCKNASAMLFTSAKAAHLNLLPQGQAEKDARAIEYGTRRWMRQDSGTAEITVNVQRPVRKISHWIISPK